MGSRVGPTLCVRGVFSGLWLSLCIPHSSSSRGYELRKNPLIRDYTPGYFDNGGPRLCRFGRFSHPVHSKFTILAYIR